MPALDRKLATISIADVDYSWLHDIIVAIHGGAPSNWAILCVCFKDDPVTLPPLDHHRKLFTNEGAGTMNMVEFFSDMSHGQIDVGESKVFGWYRLDRLRGDYVGNVYPQPDGKLNRNGFLDAAKAAATAAKVRSYEVRRRRSIRLWRHRLVRLDRRDGRAVRCQFIAAKSPGPGDGPWLRSGPRAAERIDSGLPRPVGRHEHRRLA